MKFSFPPVQEITPRLLILLLIIGLSSCATTPSGGQVHIPDGQGPFPAIIVLHTSGGLRHYEKAYASKLSGEGYVATAVNWSRGGGTNITDAYDFLAALPSVDPERIGVVGFSKGAVSGLWLASRQGMLHGRIPLAGVVNYYIGSSIVPWVESVDHPPVLFLHGSKDTYVEPIEIYNYCELVRENDSVCEYKIYEGVRHAFDRQSIYDGYNSDATKDAWTTTINFLDKYVKGNG